MLLLIFDCHWRVNGDAGLVRRKVLLPIPNGNFRFDLHCRHSEDRGRSDKFDISSRHINHWQSTACQPLRFPESRPVRAAVPVS